MQASRTSMINSPAPAILIATVGLSPQVVTLTLDELLRRGLPIQRVLVVQPCEATEGIKNSLNRLRAEVASYQESHGIIFEFCVFESEDGYRPTDTLNKRDAQVVLQTLNREISKAKQEGFRVHLSIAGGRKVISAFGTVAAQFHFDAEDRCWHVAEGTQTNREAMHPAEGEAVVLVDVPILSWKLWKRVIAGSLSLALTDDPIQTEQMLRHLEENVGRSQRLRTFFERDLDYAEQRVLALLALEGLENAELEVRLGCSVKNPLNRIVSKYTNFKDLHPGAIKRGHLIAEFQQIMLALQFHKQLPDLTPLGVDKKPHKTKPHQRASRPTKRRPLSTSSLPTKTTSPS